MAQPPRTHVGESHGPGAPKPHLVHQSLQQGSLLPWRIAGRTPVELYQIDGAPQALTGGCRCLAKAVTSQAPRVGSQLGGYGHPLALGRWEAGQTLAQQDFAAPLKLAGAIGVGGVKEGEASLDALLKGVQQQGIIPLGMVVPEQAVAPGPGAHPDGPPGWCARLLLFHCNPPVRISLTLAGGRRQVVKAAACGAAIGGSNPLARPSQPG